MAPAAAPPQKEQLWLRFFSSIRLASRLQFTQYADASDLGAFPSQPTHLPRSSRERSAARRSLNTRQSTEPSGMMASVISLAIGLRAAHLDDELH